MPQRRERAVRVVFVKEIPFVFDHFVDEVDEAPRDLRESGAIDGVAHERAVASPHVRIVIVVSPLNVGVIRRQDGTAVVALRADDEQRTAIEIDDLVR